MDGQNGFLDTKNRSEPLSFVGANLLDAAVIGTSAGLKLALNVAAMLIAFIALMTAANALLGWAGDYWFDQLWSLEAIMRSAFYPLAWTMGIESGDCFRAGELLGMRMVSNEFVAYDRFAAWLKENPAAVTERTKIILTYALFGFCNFASIGIQIGGIGGMAPTRRSELAQLGLRAMLGGTLACLMTACMAGLFL